MTLDPSTLATTAGALALVSATLKILAALIVMRRPPLPNVPIPRESVLRLSLPDIFIPMLFGILSIGFRSPLVATSFGIALCVGMGIYFALVGWALATNPTMRAAGLYIGNYISFAAACFYLAAATIARVI